MSVASSSLSSSTTQAQTLLWNALGFTVDVGMVERFEKLTGLEVAAILLENAKPVRKEALTKLEHEDMPFAVVKGMDLYFKSACPARGHLLFSTYKHKVPTDWALAALRLRLLGHTPASVIEKVEEDSEDIFNRLVTEDGEVVTVREEFREIMASSSVGSSRAGSSVLSYQSAVFRAAKENMAPELAQKVDPAVQEGPAEKEDPEVDAVADQLDGLSMGPVRGAKGVKKATKQGKEVPAQKTRVKNGADVDELDLIPSAPAEVFLYYHDGSFDPEYQGWWVGPEIDGDKVMGFAPDKLPGHFPDKLAWHFPYNKRGIAEGVSCAAKGPGGDLELTCQLPKWKCVDGLYRQEGTHHGRAVWRKVGNRRVVTSPRAPPATPPGTPPGTPAKATPPRRGVLSPVNLRAHNLAFSSPAGPATPPNFGRRR